MYLRATAMYTDSFGPGKTASVVSENPVEDQDASERAAELQRVWTLTMRVDGIQVMRTVDENAKGAQVGKPITASDDDDVLVYSLEDGSTDDVGTVNDNDVDETTLYSIDREVGPDHDEGGLGLDPNRATRLTTWIQMRSLIRSW